MRKPIKPVSSKLQKFIPKEHQDLQEDAKELKDRPMIIMGRPANREDRYNVSSLMETKNGLGEADEKQTVANLGTVARYFWNHCIVEVHNVFEPGDCIKGEEKNRLFNAEGMESEVAQAIAWVQEISRFTEDEAKN
jgi:hypothetical protein